jgi:hypothetical protein
MKTIFYRQCHLEKPTSEGTTHMTSWIPEKFAVKDKVIKLRERGIWENGWIVTTVGTSRRSWDSLPDFHSDVKGHLRATGDMR